MPGIARPHRPITRCPVGRLAIVQPRNVIPASVYILSNRSGDRSETRFLAFCPTQRRWLRGLFLGTSELSSGKTWFLAPGVNACYPDYALGSLFPGFERAEPSHFTDQPRGSANFLQRILLCAAAWSAAPVVASWRAICGAGRLA